MNAPSHVSPAAGPSARRPLEMWGGVECTVNRLGDRFVDQFDRSGHATRLSDFDRFAEIGIRTMRTSVLWERVAPDGLEKADWAWADASLGRMQAVGIEPIVGLVHHGSGPRATSLVDPGFADGLAAFATAFARRHPGVEAYTPVNEPLTTARFSGLYGHWYPHGRDEATFARALVTQVQAVSRAMAAVRRVNPAARLVQTEDLGRTWSTIGTAGQAALENERRWLTWDLLCGRVDRDHPMWDLLPRWGIGEGELDDLAEHPCPPAVVGVNHYVTSERFLDERTDRYPPHMRGTDYVDVEAVRVLRGGPGGLAALLAEAADRYGLPVAVTEAHLGCTREEQIRWLADVWAAAEHARAAGADVRAVTAWALLGSFDWDRLLTDCRGHYEPGAFDVRSDPPRPTAIAHTVRALAEGRAPDHPALAGLGWWRRPLRFAYRPATAVGRNAPPRRVDAPRGAARPIVVVGAARPLGAAVVRLCEVRGLAVEAFAGTHGFADALATHAPWAVVDALGGAGAAGEPRPTVNAQAAAERAAATAEAGATLVTFSSDAVFGPRAQPYAESERPSPETPHGRAQAAADRAALGAGALVVRTGLWFGATGPHGSFRQALDALAQGRRVVAGPSLQASVYLLDAVHAALDLLVDGEAGVWHLAMPDAPSAASLLRAAAERMGLNPSGVAENPTTAATLTSERGMLLEPSGETLDHFFFRDAGWARPAPEVAPHPSRRLAPQPL